MAVTLDELRIRCRNRADMTNSEFIDDSELDDYINNSLGELYDVLVNVYADENFLDAYEFSTSPGIDRYDLPGDFYKSYGIDLEVGGVGYSLTQFVHADRLLYKNSPDQIIDGVPRYRYRLRDGHLNIYPAPDVAYPCTLWYIRQLPRLVDTGDTVTLSIVESWLEYVEVDVAIKMLVKEESDATELLANKNLLMQRINQSAQNRNATANEPQPDEGNTLFNLRTQCRYRTGMTSTDVVSDRELTHYINQSLFELQDLMIAAYGNDYFLDAYEIQTVPDQRDYDLPVNFYKAGGVDVDVNGQFYTLSPFNWNERNIYENVHVFSYYGVPLYRYRILNRSIRLLPAPDGTHSLRVWYAPQLAPLVSDGDRVDDQIVSGWLEYVIVDVGIKMLTKALSLGNAGAAAPLSAMRAARGDLYARIQKMVENRDWANAATVTDVSLSEWGVIVHD